MSLNSIIISGIQEFFYFDIWEAFLMLLLMTIILNIQISKSQYIFHTFMIAILDLLTSNMNIPILQQVICIIIYVVYFKLIFKLNIKLIIISTIKVFFIFFILEILFAIIYQYILNINLIIEFNNLKKFKYMIPFRIVEFILIYIYYKFKKIKRR